MKYSKFRIQNFKGIKDTTVRLDGIAGASVFAFVGLNESGKTTILEAIHSFSPDDATSELIGGSEDTGVPVTERVPRHLISTFTGDVSVMATVAVTHLDWKNVCASLAEKELTLRDDTLPNEVEFERHQRFSNGDFQKSFFTLRTEFEVRKKRQKSWRKPDIEEQQLIKTALYSITPDIAYFPTFIFDFPDKIYLTNRGSSVDRFYRRVFQDVLDFDGKGHSIERDLVRRVRSEDKIIPWLTFLTLWGGDDSREKIQHVMDRAGAAISRLVFGRWNRIFGEEARSKEIVISHEVEAGEVTDAKGTKTSTNEHDLSIKFQIRDGTRRFNVNDRSLGFRWFFAFMLFTQFRVSRSRSRPLLFLFDEPASNLHAAAQQRLIDCFPEIAREPHVLAYSTHSHYMIEPKWLEQTYIVTNRADTPVKSIIDEASLDDESLDIKASSYRSFVNDHPSQTSYFQPILDRLEVVASRFDLKMPSIVFEGRSDYYLVRYATKLIGEDEFFLIPGLGATTFGALVSLGVGWSLNFGFVLDGDGEGEAARQRYVDEFGLPLNRALLLSEIAPGCTTSEDLLDAEARRTIRNELKLGSDPSKAQLKRFFQERLASNNIVPLGESFRARAEQVVSRLERLLDDSKAEAQKN